jgi:hypothetical protein
MQGLKSRKTHTARPQEFQRLPNPRIKHLFVYKTYDSILTMGRCIPDDPRTEVALDTVSVCVYTLDGEDGKDDLSAADAVVELTSVVGWAELV